MDRRKQITKYLLFYFLVVFPFGQLFRVNFSWLGFTIQPIDLVAIISLFLLKRKNFKDKTFFSLLSIILFSLLVSLNLFKPIELLTGVMYCIRILGYFAFYINLKNLFEEGKARKPVINSLLSIFIITAILGWIQYLILPDFRSFKVLGWDDHWFRLLGSFLDPGFMGIILVLGFILSYGLYIKNRTLSLLLLALIFIVSVAFTYSRASYLALVLGGLVLAKLNKGLKIFVVIIFSFLLIILSLPRTHGSGVQLERTFSIIYRIENYKEGLEIFSKSPVFGIGFNNLCKFKIEYLKAGSINSHSCGGLDSSIIFVLATTGILGFLILSNLCYRYLKTVNFNNSWHRILFASLVAIGVHSQFVNSLFYPWVMGYVAVFAAFTFTKKK